LAVGAKFRGYNRSGDYEWHADCEVTVLEPGRRFAYLVSSAFEHATEWSYTIEPDGDGCIVTEAFHAPMLALPEVYPGKIEGRRDTWKRRVEPRWTTSRQRSNAEALTPTAVGFRRPPTIGRWPLHLAPNPPRRTGSTW